MALEDRTPIAKWVNILGVIALLFGLGAAILMHLQNNGDRMTREELAWNMIADGALVLDVRTQAEFDSGHLDGALHIPHTDIGSRLAELGDDTSRPIVIYCKAGGRAGTAEKVLGAYGWTNLHNAGGYDAIMKAKEG